MEDSSKCSMLVAHICKHKAKLARLQSPRGVEADPKMDYSNE